MPEIKQTNEAVRFPPSLNLNHEPCWENDHQYADEPDGVTIAALESLGIVSFESIQQNFKLHAEYLDKRLL